MDSDSEKIQESDWIANSVFLKKVPEDGRIPWCRATLPGRLYAGAERLVKVA
jgi:hypothetical protein